MVSVQICLNCIGRPFLKQTNGQTNKGARKMAQRLRILAALLEDRSSVLIINTRQLTACNPSSRESNAHFWPLRLPRHIQPFSHMRIIILNLFIFKRTKLKK